MNFYFIVNDDVETLNINVNLPKDYYSRYKFKFIYTNIHQFKQEQTYYFVLKKSLLQIFKLKNFT